MILGFFISGKVGFITFEHYFVNFSQFVDSKTDFFDFLESTTYKLGSYEFSQVTVKISELNETHSLGVIYLSSKQLKDFHLTQLKTVCEQLTIADKEMTHTVLKSRYATDLLY